MRKIALVKAELIVVIIILLCLTIIVKRSNRNAELIDRSSVELGHDDSHGVIAGLLNAGNIGNRFRDGNHLLDILRGVVNSGKSLIGLAGRMLGVNHLRKVGTIGIRQCCLECLDGVVRNVKAPVRSRTLDVSIRVVPVVYTVSNDLFCQDLGYIVVELPVSGLCRFVPKIKVGIVFAGFENQSGEALHVGTIRAHAFDRLCEQG